MYSFQKSLRKKSQVIVTYSLLVRTVSKRYFLLFWHLWMYGYSLNMGYEHFLLNFKKLLYFIWK